MEATKLKSTRVAVAAVAVLALVAGAGVAAAAPGDGNAPDDAGQAGPPTDLPDRVPDFVGESHEESGSFLDGSVDSLGSTVSDLTPGGEASADDGNESESAA